MKKRTRESLAPDLTPLIDVVFLLLIFFMFSGISVNNYVFKAKESKLNFSTKVQVYLNFAFFVPLIIISIVIISMMSFSNSQETKSYYLEKAQSVGSNITTILEDFKNGKLNNENLSYRF